MSRSFKKTPIVKDRRVGGKKFANHKVRRSEDVPNGKAYRKFYNSYDISDFKFRRTKMRYVKMWNHKDDVHNFCWKNKSFYDAMRFWHKIYYWK